jgi:uncharacterized membrane protein YfcA
MTTLDPGGAVLVGAAAFLAGAINAVAGGGSLLSFPALLLVHFHPLVANVTNTIGLLPGYAGGSIAYRRELAGQERRAKVLSVCSVAGAVAGALLLVHTSGHVFAAVVPWLLLISCALLLAQPLVSKALHDPRAAGGATHPVLVLGQFATAVYGAFFGAGLSVLTLAILGLFLHDDIQRLNALKGVLSFVVNVVAAVCFLFLAPVAWSAVALMLPASFTGGVVGVALARRISASWLRAMIVAFGVAVAIRLLV